MFLTESDSTVVPGFFNNTFEKEFVNDLSPECFHTHTHKVFIS